MSDSKSGSKSNLNESNMPLLDDEQVDKSGEEKEAIEMKEEGGEVKDESKEEKEKRKKEKKEKKKEELRLKKLKPKGPGCIETWSAKAGLNVETRDQKDINVEVNIDFDDVLAEPLNAQGFELVWRLTYILFSQTKLWLYRIFSALLAIPAALVWALVFSLITVAYVWLLAPFLKLVDLFVSVVRRVWTGVLACTLEPVCFAVGSVFSKMNVPQNRRIVQDA